MYAVKYPTGFSVDEFVQHEAPVTFGLFHDPETVRSDLDGLFAYPTEHKDAMPFYVFGGREAVHVAQTSEQVYDALCAAMDWLANNRWAIPEYFGTDFCNEYPEFINYALWTWETSQPAIYGRFDMAMDPERGQVTGVYEFNGNTPVMLFESTILQNWLTEKVNAEHGTRYDQHNIYYPEMQKALDKVLKKHRSGKTNVGVLLHAEYIEDAATCETLFQLFDAYEGCDAYIDHIDNVGFDMLPDADSPWTIAGEPMENLFVLQPWEEIVASCYYDVIAHWRSWCHKVQIMEPAWRWFLANKGIMAVATYLLETDVQYRYRYGHLPFLRTYVSPEPFTAAGEAYVAKPLIGRLSNNIRIHGEDGTVNFESDGSYGEEPCVYQEYCPPGKVEGRNNFIVGQWMCPYVDDPAPLVMQASSLCIREFDQPVLSIKNERFIPHLIADDGYDRNWAFEA